MQNVDKLLSDSVNKVTADLKRSRKLTGLTFSHLCSWKPLLHQVARNVPLGSMKQWVETAGFVDPVQPPPVSMISPKSITYVSPVRDDPNLLRWFGILDSCSADDKAAVFRMNRVCGKAG